MILTLTPTAASNVSTTWTSTAARPTRNGHGNPTAADSNAAATGSDATATNDAADANEPRSYEGIL